ncbi:MAG: DoxX family protein [Actinomycetales bacterium]
MHIVEIALQVILGMIFLAAGLTKVVASKAALQPKMAWVDSFPAVAVKGIGAAEALGALALLLPLVSPLPNALALLAAICLAITMVLAIVVHVRLKETAQSLPAGILLLLLLALIALLIAQ